MSLIAGYSYSIVMPSYRRPKNMAQMAALLPRPFNVVVRPAEYEAYKEALAPYSGIHIVQLPSHVRTQTATFQAVYDMDWKSDFLFIIDDDFERLMCRTGQLPRFYRDPLVTQAVIEQGVNFLGDTDGALFTWSMKANPLQFMASSFADMHFALPGGAYIMNRKKMMALDTELTGFLDADLLLQYLEKHRWVFSDTRWYWDCGASWSGEGGGGAIRSPESDNHDMDYMRQKWGAHIDFPDTVTNAQGKKIAPTTTGLRVKVNRKSPLAVVR